MNCPHCGGEIETQQKRAVEARWARVREKREAKGEVESVKARLAEVVEMRCEKCRCVGHKKGPACMVPVCGCHR